jgi:hypothetical protein
MICGQPNNHIFNWTGENFKQLVLPGWGRRRLPDTLENRVRLHALIDAVDQHALFEKIRAKTGSTHTDAQFELECRVLPADVQAYRDARDAGKRARAAGESLLELASDHLKPLTEVAR